MNTIPLVKGNTQEEINTSLIALKKALDEMNSSSSKTDTSVQSQIKQINELITNINSQITDLQPVDSVTSGNMHSVTSNAVAGAFGKWKTIHSFDSNNYVECKQLYNDKILHFHFNGYNMSVFTIGTSIGTIPDNYRPTDTVRFLIDIDLYDANDYLSGRMPINIDYRTDGILYLYPIIQNQATGQLSRSARLFGDGYIVI